MEGPLVSVMNARVERKDHDAKIIVEVDKILERIKVEKFTLMYDV